MEGGAEYFKKPMPFYHELEGDVDGVKFNVKGEGIGDITGVRGIVDGKYVCTQGVCPVSWSSLIITLQYGYQYVDFFIIVFKLLKITFFI